MDLDLDLAPPFALRLIVFCSYESVKSVEGGFTSRASGSADAFADLRLTDGADGAADAADAAFAAAADSLLRAVALLARAFLSSRFSSSRFCFAAAAAAAAAAASCFAASALVAPDISSSNANLAAGSPDANSNCGHSNPTR